MQNGNGEKPDDATINEWLKDDSTFTKNLRALLWKHNGDRPKQPPICKPCSEALGANYILIPREFNLLGG